MLQEVKIECIAKWSENSKLDKRLQAFSDEYDEWISQFPNEYIPLALKLLKEVHYFTKKKANFILQQLHLKLKDKFDITDDNTIYSFIKSKDGETNSSNDYWTEYKNINDINKHLCFEDISKIESEQWKYINNIVFIDDFSGTGKSIQKELEKHIEIFKNKNVYIILVSVMTKAKDKLERFGVENDITIVCLYGECREKIFMQDIFENGYKARTEYMEMTETLSVNEPLGRDKTQAMIALYNNTPNNTLGFIHSKSEKYRPIFPRKMDKRPIWQQLSDDKKNRKAANYNNSKI